MKFKQEQYDMLKRCSAKKDMTEWNQWREEHPDEEIYLEGANLSNRDLRGVWLHEDPVNRFGKVYLRGAVFRYSQLENAKFWRAHLEGADFYRASGTKGANFTLAHLEGADFSFSNLKGAQFPLAAVDSRTLFFSSEIDKSTWFNGVGLSSVRIDPGTKQRLEYNIRRQNWEAWYRGHRFLKWPVRWFWSLSDYGLTTLRIIFWFFGLALAFAAIYGYWAYSSPPGIVSDLMVEPHLPAWHYFALLLVRPFYFSVVTMTTLGFGDMHADPQSVWGHILLTIQVILGYLLLGALITRFAVLFTAGGPAGKFADEEKSMEAKKGR